MDDHAPRSAGVPLAYNTSIFQPPQSPAYTAPPSTLAATNDYFSQRSRKRQRPGSSDFQHEVGLRTPGAWREEPSQRHEALTPSWVQCPTPTDGMYGSIYAHSSALVNERYRLRGGFDTPGFMASGVDGRYNKDEDLEFRRRVRDAEYTDRGPAGQAMISGPLARERNGAARMHSSPSGQAGWASFAFGLVGKVFTFGSSVIKGFYAGGGKGYELQQQGLSDSWMQTQQRGSATPVPGSWQEEGDFEQNDPTSPSNHIARPPNKRRQTDKDSWVMVGTPDATELSPKRKTSSTSIPRSSLATRPSASRANSRRSLAPVSRRTSSYTGSPAIHHITPSADVPHTRRASVAPTRSPISGESRPMRPSLGARPSSSHYPGLTARTSLDSRPSSAAGISPEAEKYVRRQAKQAKATDKAIGSMNRQLQGLIAQAQQALGTKYEIDSGGCGEMDMDEGFVDEEW